MCPSAFTQFPTSSISSVCIKTEFSLRSREIHHLKSTLLSFLIRQTACTFYADITARVCHAGKWKAGHSEAMGRKKDSAFQPLSILKKKGQINSHLKLLSKNILFTQIRLR